MQEALRRHLRCVDDGMTCGAVSTWASHGGTRLDCRRDVHAEDGPHISTSGIQWFSPPLLVEDVLDAEERV